MRRQVVAAAVAAALAGGVGAAAMTVFEHVTTPPPPLTGSSQDMRYRQGVILSFNPATLENVVDVGGTQLTNLPILGVGEATLLTPGSVVGLIVVGDEGQGKTMAIIGRIVTPNTPDATDAIGLLNSQIAAVLIPDVVTMSETAAFTALSDGPVVTVDVGPSGRLLIIATTEYGLGGSPGASSVNVVLSMATFLSGANTYTPTLVSVLTDTTGFAQASIAVAPSSGTATISHNGSLMVASVFEGLNEGVTTVDIRFDRTSGNASNTVALFNRSLIVIKL